MKKLSFIAASLLMVTVASCAKRTSLNANGVNRVEIRMDPEYVGEIMRGAPEKIYYPAKAKVNGITYPVMMQPAGASTIREPKKSWDLKFTGKNPYGAEQMRLASTITDRSMLRAMLALDVFKAAGFKTSAIEPTFVYLNDTVLGLYYRIERIDKDFFKARKINWRRYYETASKADFAPDMILRLDSAFQAKPDDNVEVMGIITRLVQNPDDGDFENKIFEILDRDSVVNYMSASLITNHYDGFKKNLYFYEEMGDVKLKLLPWDFDLDWYDGPPSSSFTAINPLTVPWASSALFIRLYKLNSVQNAIAVKTAALVAGPASLATLQASLVRYQAMIAEAYSADPRLRTQGLSLSKEATQLSQTITDWFANL